MVRSVGVQVAERDPASAAPGRWVLGWELTRRELADPPAPVATAAGDGGELVDAGWLAAALLAHVTSERRAAQAQRLTAPLSATARAVLAELRALAGDDGRGLVDLDSLARRLRLALWQAGEACSELVQHGCARSEGYAGLTRTWGYQLATVLRRARREPERRGASR